jgi:sulfur carrier protein
VKVRLRNPERELPRRVRDVLSELSIDPDTVLVIRGGTLLNREDRVGEDDHVEIRPVTSGGSDAAEQACAPAPGQGTGSRLGARRPRKPSRAELYGRVPSVTGGAARASTSGRSGSN